MFTFAGHMFKIMNRAQKAKKRPVQTGFVFAKNYKKVATTQLKQD
jgi:hypothetical protein